MLGASGRLCVTDLIGSHVRLRHGMSIEKQTSVGSRPVGLEYLEILYGFMEYDVPCKWHGVRCTVQVAWSTMYRVSSMGYDVPCCIFGYGISGCSIFGCRGSDKTDGMD